MNTPRNTPRKIPRRLINARRRGFATLTAMTMIAMLAVAVTAMTQRLMDHTEKLHDSSIDAQLRQLLQAGTRAAGKLIVHPKTEQKRSVTLPLDLEDRGGTLDLISHGGRSPFERFVLVKVSLDGRTAQQTLRYVRAGNFWAMVEATLSR